jgi:hypothetical protein
LSFIRSSGPGPRVSAALAAAVLLLAIVAGSATASESHGALRDPSVAPRHGTPATVIRFSVTFQGHGLRSDAHVSVLIDGVPSAMALALDLIVANGDPYRLSTTLPVGTHTIRFRGADGSGTVSISAGQVEIDAGSSGGPIGGGGGGNNPGATPSEPPAPPTATPPAPTATPAPSEKPAPTPTPAPAAPTPTPRADGGSSDGAGPTPSPATGGAQATSPDASGAADHTSGPGGGPAPGGSPADAPPTAGREYDSAGAIAVLSPTSTPEGLALGLTGTPDAGGGGSGGTGGAGDPGGRLDDRALGLLTGDGTGIPPATRMLVAAISTTTTATAVAAFFLFGKRRRDGEPPAPDEVLAANAGRLATTPASSLVPGTDPGSGVRSADEAGIPRWRRPSLIEARKTDPRYAATATHDRMSFNHGGDPGTAGTERRKIRYRAVSLLDAPDPLRSAAIGDLDEGDEVQLLEKSGGYWLVLCPDGSRGWVHRMTLGDVVEYEGGSGAFNAARRSFTPRISDAGNDRTDDTDDGSDGSGPGAAGGAGGTAPSTQREDDRSYAEDGTDLLTSYLKSRRATTT